MLHLVMLLASVLPLLVLLCFKPHKSQPKTQVQQSSGGSCKPPSGRTFASGAHQPQSTPPPVPSSGPADPKSSTMTAPPRPSQQPAAAVVTVATASKSREKKKEQPSSGGGSQVAKRRAGTGSAKLAKSQSKKKENKLLQLLKTPKRRNRGDSLEAFTCEDGRSRERTEELTQIQSERTNRELQVDYTAQTKESDDVSMFTAEDEAYYEEAKYHVLGNVDELIQDQGYGDDWLEYVGDRLQSEGSVTCDQPTERDASALICTSYRIWLAEKIGSGLDAEGPAPEQQ